MTGRAIGPFDTVPAIHAKIVFGTGHCYYYYTSDIQGVKREKSKITKNHFFTESVNEFLQRVGKNVDAPSVFYRGLIGLLGGVLFAPGGLALDPHKVATRKETGQIGPAGGYAGAHANPEAMGCSRVRHRENHTMSQEPLDDRLLHLGLGPLPPLARRSLGFIVQLFPEFIKCVYIH